MMRSLGQGDAAWRSDGATNSPVETCTSRVAIITARGGSKRLPRKNIRAFEGRPIIAWAIEAALASELFDEVMVSTDDDEIAAVATHHGAVVPFRRSAATANDHATTADVLREVLDTYAARSRHFSHACCLYPTAPFVTPALLQRGWRMLVDEARDMVFPLARHPSPVQRALRVHDDGRVERMQPEHEQTRSQDLEPAFYDAGQFYWFVVATLLRDGVMLGRNSAGLVVDESRVQDIDDEKDWRTAEQKFRAFDRAA